MSAISIQVPFPVFQDRDGQPLDNGYVWIGEPNLNPQTNPVVAYYDAALTIQAAQPLRTINGYVSRAGTPAQIYVDGVNFSILVQDSKGTMVYNFPEGTGISQDACGVTYNPPFTGAVSYPVCEKLEQIVSVQDFGAVGDGVTDDTVAFQAAEAASDFLYLPEGSYLVSYAPTKTFLGPGDIVNSGLSAVTFSGSGANDIDFYGSFSGTSDPIVRPTEPIQLKIRIVNAALPAVTTTGYTYNGINAQGWETATITHTGGQLFANPGSINFYVADCSGWIQINNLVTTAGTLNGNYMVLTSASGSVTIYLQTTINGTQSSAGTMQNFDTFEYSFNGGVTYLSTYGDFLPVPLSLIFTSIPLTCNISSVNLNQFPNTRVFAYQGLYVHWTSNRGHNTGDSWSVTLTPPAEKLYTEGNSINLNGDLALCIDNARNISYGVNVFGNKNNVGTDNIGIGIDTLVNNTIGSTNVAVGGDALRFNQRGINNVALGHFALNKNVNGNQNVALGNFALGYQTTGTGNIAIGMDCMGYTSTATDTIAIGEQAFMTVNSGRDNVAIGRWALRGGTSGIPSANSNDYCTAVGAVSQSLTFNCEHNTSVGYYALYQDRAGYNTAVGSNAGLRNSFGYNNIFIGYNAGQNVAQLDTGENQIVIGVNAYTTGNYGIAIGRNAVAGILEAVIGGGGYSTVRTGSDNTTSSGAASYRWSVVYAATGTINTSDEREKQQIKPIDDAALRAWAKVEYCQFKFNDAVEKKGDGARWHFGLVAQRVKEAFESEGLNAFEYGVLCYDEWADEYQDVVVEKTRQIAVGDKFVDEKYSEPTGEKKLVKAGGNRYGIRYEEALALECAYLRSQLNKE